MKIANDAKKQRTITILMLTITLVLGTIPSALANTPNVSAIPSSTVLGGTNTIKVLADSSTLKHDRSTMAMYDPDVTSVGAPTFPGGIARCGPNTGGVKWELRDSADLTTPVVFTMSSVGSSFKVIFGTDGVVIIFDVTPGTTLSTLSAKWVDVSGGNDPAKYDILTNPSDPLDRYVPRACGFENVAVFGTGGEFYEAKTSISVVQPVGGSILPIDATSLVLAGIFTNAFWFLPIVGAASAAGIGMYRLRK